MLIDVFEKFLISLLILSPLEMLLPRNKIAIFREKRLLDLLYVFGAVFIISSITTGVIVVGVMIFGPLVPAGFNSWVGGQNMIVQVIAIMIIADLGYYTLHRMHHEIPFLWKFHAVHHSIEELDWLAAYRTHPFDQSLTRGVSLVPVFALGFSTAAIGVWSVIFMWHALLKHSNIKINFGPFRWILMEPVFHHWHHANEKHAFDKNYAGQLPILDVIFGTAIMENRFGPSKYGTDTYVPDDFVGQLFHPIKSALLDDDKPSQSDVEIETLSEVKA